MRIDHFLPDYRFVERHERRIQAPASRVQDALREVTVAEVRLLAPLTALRMPSRLRALVRGPRDGRARPLLQVALRSGFLLLEEQEGEVVLGTIGRFWRLAGAVTAPVATPSEFVAFDEPGFAKAVINFRIEPGGDGTCRLSTETRIAPIDAAARRRFACYWAVIRPGSGLIRRSCLAAVKRRAERTQTTPA